MTDAGEHATVLRELPDSISLLRQILQGLTVHVFWAERYGLQLSPERQAETQIRPARRKLARLLQLSPAPLPQERPLESRLVCNCRDLSVLFCAILRAKGVPVRARCGFGTYFMPGRYEDHWVCEYWLAAEQRWVMLDPQLDAFQVQTLGISFDPLDLPPGAFVVAGQAWQMCRRGDADPDKFGIFQWHGLGFIAGNVARDLLALDKFEVLPWDHWGLLDKPVDDFSSEDMALVDSAVALAGEADADPRAVRDFCAQTPHLQAPAEWAL
jgi:hypothetical protein